MTPKKMLELLVVLLLAAGSYSGTATAAHHEAAPGANAPRRDVLYSCNCGPECTCNTVSTKPGDCKCGKPLAWGHVVRVEGNEAVLCTCSEGCRCEGLDPNDPTKCSCGKSVKRVSLKGTGVYFCNCGGSCGCNTVSAEPGKCRCGMDLKKVD